MVRSCSGGGDGDSDGGGDGGGGDSSSSSNGRVAVADGSRTRSDGVNRTRATATRRGNVWRRWSLSSRPSSAAHSGHVDCVLIIICRLVSSPCACEVSVCVCVCACPSAGTCVYVRVNVYYSRCARVACIMYMIVIV